MALEKLIGLGPILNHFLINYKIYIGNKMKKALVVGINNYPFSPLRGCENDATEVGKVLQTNDNGSPNFGVRLELNVGSKSVLKTMISELFSGDCETSLLYFSGHGYTNELGGYIVTPDAAKYDEGVSMGEILTWANESKIRDKIIILDCCYSGNMGEIKITQGGSYLNDGLTILTSSMKDETSLEINNHGVFTSLLLSALEGGAADLRGEISPGSVYAYIDQALGAWDQRPVFKTNVKRFTSLRTVKPQVPVEVLRKLVEYFPNQQAQFELNPSFEFTNDPNIEHKCVEPYAISEKVSIFKDLQKFQSVGLVVPVDAAHMYFAAMDSKNCKLTALGAHYWRLVNSKKI
ncbi:caspase family protein [Ignavibacteriales bacterium]